jgi:hypothetical protein
LQGINWWSMAALSTGAIALCVIVGMNGTSSTV